MSGWIKLHRAVEDNPIVTRDNDYFRVWIHMLLRASHSGDTAVFRNERIIINPGQFISGRKQLSVRTCINESKIYRILKAFKNEQQIEQQTSTTSSLFTIVNWNRYQIGEQQNERKMNNDRTASEQQVNTIKEEKKDKNEENLKNKIRSKSSDLNITFDQNDHFSKIWEEYPLKRGKEKAFRAFRGSVKSEKHFKDLQTALKNYIEDCTQCDRIFQNGDTFFRNWKEWLALPKKITTPKEHWASKFVKGELSDEEYDALPRSLFKSSR